MIGTLLKPPRVAGLARLRAAARQYPCVLCGKEGATVAAHCNDLNLFPRSFGWLVGKGIGTKADDFLIAYLCGDPGGCHDLVDGRAGKLSKAEKRALWDEAYKRTVALWFVEGLIEVT